MQGLSLHSLLADQAGTPEMRLAPPNSVLFVSGTQGAQIPDIDLPGNVWWSENCVVVGCLSFIDGAMIVSLQQNVSDREGLELAYDGVIETPSRVLIVSTSEREIVLQHEVPSLKTNLRIWTNHSTEPNEIRIDVQ